MYSMQVSAVADGLDTIILSATEAGVSAKYAKKVLKRLQRQLDIIRNPAKPSAETAPSPPAAEAPEQEPAEHRPLAEQPHSNGSRDFVAQPAAPPRPQISENGAQQHARPGVKIQAQVPLVPMVQPLAPPPARKAPPPGFVRLPKQSPQQSLQGKPAWTPVKLPAASGLPVVPPRSSAMPQTHMQPNGPGVRAAPPVQQVRHLALAAMPGAWLGSSLQSPCVAEMGCPCGQIATSISSALIGSYCDCKSDGTLTIVGAPTICSGIYMYGLQTCNKFVAL